MMYVIQYIFNEILMIVQVVRMIFDRFIKSTQLTDHNYNKCQAL